MESRSVKQLLLEGKGKEQVKEADDVKLNVAEDTDKVKIKGEYHAGERRILENKFLEQDRVYEYEDNQYGLNIDGTTRSIVERAKGKSALYRVHSGLGDGIEKHYETVLVSIGPCHHGKTPLQAMEKHKIHYLRVLLDRVKQRSSSRYVDALKNGGEMQGLNCYQDTHRMDVDSFVEYMDRGGSAEAKIATEKRRVPAKIRTVERCRRRAQTSGIAIEASRVIGVPIAAAPSRRSPITGEAPDATLHLRSCLLRRSGRRSHWKLSSATDRDSSAQPQWRKIRHR
ncbi:hypothetical protein TIFTF001_034281 [Ficus carica]|uniref:Uncharacterized protein n=1 Tax=Ficus carica TaxID=3494 RepID=A0AA88E0V7_FICCA|nr:hypothetical protein TIFTF001_034281 [Ficus carica]